MNRQVVMGILAGMVLLAGNALAKEVNLNPGEAYRQRDLTVTCGQPSTDIPLALKDCQYWDDFNKECLFEKTTYSYRNIECVEECQHWDAFFSTCHYQTKCTFYPSQKSFVQTTCEKFDDFNKTCVQTKDAKIGL
ncbi:MAG: hypothetical protein KKD73_14005 [Proteobacteria bacterium]|nr:hypothetical protein [Pseudomonadota bacterium]MBU1639336.1 hypothetical protein [Pseudomonadota bacterium]